MLTNNTNQAFVIKKINEFKIKIKSTIGAGLEEIKSLNDML